MAFKQRSQGSSFKEMGSSPAKQSSDLTDMKTLDKEIDLSKMSNKEIEKVVKRNISVPHFKHKRTYDTRTDSVAAARVELNKRYDLGLLDKEIKENKAADKIAADLIKADKKKGK